MNTVRHLAVVTALAGATGCQAIGDIFKAGMWVGIVVVGGIALLIFGGVTLLRR